MTSGVNSLNCIKNDVGTILFDTNDNIISYSGIGKDRVADVKEFSVLTIEDGQALPVSVSGTDLKAYLYKRCGAILVVYTSTMAEPSSTDNNV